MNISISKNKITVFSLLFSLLSSFALLSGRCVDIHRGASSHSYGFGWVLFAVLCICLFFAYRFLFDRGIMAKRLRLSVLLSLFLSAWYLAGKIFFYTYSVLEKVNYLQYAFIFAGSFIFYLALIKAVYIFLENVDFSGNAVSKLHGALTRHTFRNSFIIIFIFRLPHLLIKYPSGVCGDAAGQLSQCFYQYSTHHPLTHTLLLGAFVKLGIRLGSANAGLFAFTVVETVIGALICGYCVSTMEKHGCRKWTVLFALLFFCLNGHIGFYVGECGKDVYYSFFSLLFVTLLCEYVSCRESFISDKRKLLLLFAACGGVWLFRNNGKYIVVPVAAVICIIELRHFLKEKDKKASSLIICLLLGVILPFAFSKTLEVVTHAEKGSIAEALSLPFQQTARFVKYHSDELSDEEKRIIDSVLIYGDLADSYMPEVSDPVKAGYRSWAGAGELADYLVLLARMFFREPVCYIASVVEQSYYLFFPDFNNYYYFLDASPCSAYSQLYTVYTPECIADAQQSYRGFIRFFHAAPIIELFNNMSVYVILVCIIFVCTLNKKNYGFLIVLLPLIISILTVFAGPCIKGHPRYVYPCIYSFPVIVGFYGTNRNIRKKG